MKESLIELKARIEKLGLSWQDVAIRSGKERTTVIKQLSQDGNPTLETLETYAAAVGGKIHFLPDDWETGLREVDKLNERIIMLSEHIGSLKTENELLKTRIEKQDGLLDKRLQRINELQDLLTDVIRKLMERI